MGCPPPADNKISQSEVPKTNPLGKARPETQFAQCPLPVKLKKLAFLPHPPKTQRALPERKDKIKNPSMNIFHHAAELGNCQDELTAFVDRVLDNYPNNPEKSTSILKEILALKKDLEALQTEFDTYITKNL